jgi:hypothetical protein
MSREIVPYPLFKRRTLTVLCRADYIRFYHLRTYDVCGDLFSVDLEDGSPYLLQRLNAPMSFIAEMEKRSGTRFEDAQVALARQWLGPDDQPLGNTVKIKYVDTLQSDPASMGLVTPENTKEKVKEVKVPPTVEVAVEIIKKFEGGAPRSDENVADTISQHVQQDRTNILDENWLGEFGPSGVWSFTTEFFYPFLQALTSRRKHGTSDLLLTSKTLPLSGPPCSLVSELVYIHSKVMIVDDKRVIVRAPSHTAPNVPHHSC